jgi:hypothetical protein
MNHSHTQRMAPWISGRLTISIYLWQRPIQDARECGARSWQQPQVHGKCAVSSFYSVFFLHTSWKLFLSYHISISVIKPPYLSIVTIPTIDFSPQATRQRKPVQCSASQNCLSKHYYVCSWKFFFFSIPLHKLIQICVHVLTASDISGFNQPSPCQFFIGISILGTSSSSEFRTPFVFRARFFYFFFLRCKRMLLHKHHRLRHACMHARRHAHVQVIYT